MVIIERFGHGGDVWTAAEAFGRSSGEFVDFSANINPLGPPPSVMARLREELAGIIHYPDPGHRRMKEALSRRLQVGCEQLLIGNGAAECMALAILAHAPRTVGVVAPCFSEYEALSRQFGADVVRVIGQASRDYRAEWPELERLSRMPIWSSSASRTIRPAPYTSAGCWRKRGGWRSGTERC